VKLFEKFNFTVTIKLLCNDNFPRERVLNDLFNSLRVTHYDITASAALSATVLFTFPSSPHKNERKKRARERENQFSFTAFLSYFPLLTPPPPSYFLIKESSEKVFLQQQAGSVERK
jgi:hypothetical protein